jgi:lipoprotein signal peptidase
VIATALATGGIGNGYDKAIKGYTLLLWL